MAERKITGGSFDRGQFRKIIDKQVRVRNLSDAGRARVEDAIKAGMERESQKFGLRYGVSGAHADALVKFTRSNQFEGRRDLKPREREVIADSLGTFFKTKPGVPKAETKVPRKVEPTRIEPRKMEFKTIQPPPKAPEPPPQQAA